MKYVLLSKTVVCRHTYSVKRRPIIPHASVCLFSSFLSVHCWEDIPWTCVSTCLPLPHSEPPHGPCSHHTVHSIKEPCREHGFGPPTPPPWAPYAQCSHRLRPLIYNVGIHHLLFGLVTGIEQEGRCQHACGCLWLPSLVRDSLALSHHPLTCIFEHLILYETLQ